MSSAKWLLIVLLLIVLLLTAGCSAHDPPTQTPVYHTGTPTNRSSVNSWELNSEPANTQPGVYRGRPAALKPIASERGFEPDDPVAEAVLNALTAGGVPTQYLSARAKNGVVVLAGGVPTPAQKARASAIARVVVGVKYLDDRVIVVKPGV